VDEEQLAKLVERALSPELKECFICQGLFSWDSQRSWRLTCSDHCHSVFNEVNAQFGIDVKVIRAWEDKWINAPKMS
jgi:hypothetical protein